MSLLGIPTQTPLEGKQLKRAEKTLKASAKLGDGASLFSDEKLIKLGFSRGGGSPIPDVSRDHVGGTPSNRGP